MDGKLVMLNVRLESSVSMSEPTNSINNSWSSSTFKLIDSATGVSSTYSIIILPVAAFDSYPWSSIT